MPLNKLNAIAQLHLQNQKKQPPQPQSDQQQASQEQDQELAAEQAQNGGRNPSGEGSIAQKKAIYAKKQDKSKGLK